MSDNEEDDIVGDLPSSSQGKRVSGGLRRQVLTNKRPPVIPMPFHETPKRDNTPLTWDEFFDSKTDVTIGDDVFNVYTKGRRGPIFYLLHGGGYSGLTWAVFAKELLELIECRVVAPDLRGHGETKCIDEHDLSKETMVKDIGNIFNTTFPRSENEEVCIIGHSMGGAMAVHAGIADVIKAKIVGVVVIDVCEGTAMESINGMLTFLQSRPTSFTSVESAISWCISSKTARNTTAARVSMPAQIRMAAPNEYEWRIDLAATEVYWKGWFEGLSAEFLKLPASKMLALASVDRLDKTLTVAQMQGKFQTAILQKVGHSIQEDNPERLADAIGSFAIRQRFAAPPMIVHSPTPSPRAEEVQSPPKNN